MADTKKNPIMQISFSNKRNNDVALYKWLMSKGKDFGYSDFIKQILYKEMEKEFEKYLPKN